MNTTTPMSPHVRIPAGGGESRHVLGDLVHVKVTAEQTAGAFSTFEIVAAPGGGPPLHLHAAEIVVPLYPKRAPIRVTAPPPAHMRELLSACGWKREP
jgi:hypothetical protein